MPIVSHYEIQRGRSSELEQTGTGTATITMIDTNGSLDPSTGSTDFDPMKPVAIALTNPVTGTSSPIFRGHVARWSYDPYPTGTYATATLDCVDGMDVLAAIEMTPGDFGDISGAGTEGNIIYLAAEQVAHRIGEILDECDWPLGLREVFSGNVRLQPTTYAPRATALSAIFEAADGEHPGVANFFISREGKAVFHGRLARFRPLDAQYHISIWRAGDEAAVAADSSRAVIVDVDYDRDKDKIINSALATPQGIADEDIEGQRVQNTASIAAYGTRSWSAENLITASDHFGAATAEVATKKFATYYVNNFKDPRTRVNRISFSSRGRPTDARVWAILCGVDISDIIRLTYRGFVDEDFYVEAIHYDVSPLNDQYLDVQLDLDVSPRAHYNTNPFE
jgi:hypothetical protein